jgi:tetratricopeptide (TPR) repeat protein
VIHAAFEVERMSRYPGEDFEALHQHAINCARSGRLYEAESLFRRVLACRPRDARAHSNYGNVLRYLGRLEESLRSYDCALALDESYPEAHNNRGNTLRALGRAELAAASYEAAIVRNPGYAEAYYNLGLVLRELFRLPEALTALNRALEIAPTYADVYNERGLVLREMDQFGAALGSFERALALNPKHVIACSNRGLTLQNMNRPDEAIESFNAALAIQPNHPAALHNRAYAHLLAGNLAAGWEDYEWRWLDPASPLAAVSRDLGPQWTGSQCLRGRRILIWSEQGFGDTLQFCRYIPLLAERGAHVLLQVQPPLTRLLAGLSGVAEFFEFGSTKAFDYHCPLLSLPRAFGTVLSSVPNRIPYLRVPNEVREHWRHRLASGARLRVGLVWAGGVRSRQPELASVNRRRNIPLEMLAHLQHPDVQFFSLQKGDPAESEAAVALSHGWKETALINLGSELQDFVDTAAVLEELDLLISVDTAPVHLAGALGRPVWILNRFDACWRWLLERTDSPWYPTVRLYRQPRIGDWGDLVERVREDLKAEIASPSHTRRTQT